ncbi:MAG: ABC transporter permease [Bacteroidales bacterium]|nr:ABC transporter permease [Bacteroidales bacterium]
MNVPFFIAKRYLISRKSRNIINIISAVSVGGILIGTMALIIVLSVTNGFQQLATSLFNVFDPDIKISPVVGKTFTPDQVYLDKLYEIEGVRNVTSVVEETALVKYGDKQVVARLKGYSDDFTEYATLDSAIIDGSLKLKSGQHDFAVIGVGVAMQLNVHLSNFTDHLSVFIPKRNLSSGVLDQGFINKNIAPSGVFSLQQEIDSKYILLPLRFMRELLEYNNELTSLEIMIDADADIEDVQIAFQELLNDDFVVKNRFQQQELLYKIMKSEKLVTFFILAFIILVASFNVIGVLTILILDKKKDIGVLWSMGADSRLIKQIFLFEGILVTLIGALGGLLVGGLISWLQQNYGFIQLQSEGNFIVDAYPVKILWQDFVLVFGVVASIGLLASWLAIRNLKPSLMK